MDILNVIILRKGRKENTPAGTKRGELGACLDLVITRHGSRKMCERLDEAEMTRTATAANGVKRGEAGGDGAAATR